MGLLISLFLFGLLFTVVILFFSMFRNVFFILVVVFWIGMLAFILAAGAPYIEAELQGAATDIVENSPLRVFVDVVDVLTDIVDDFADLFNKAVPKMVIKPTSAKSRPVDQFYREILGEDELPSEKVVKDAERAAVAEHQRLAKEMKETEQRIKDIRKQAAEEAKTANAKAFRDQLKPKTDEEMISRIAEEVAAKMLKAQNAQKPQQTA